jgi:hypothetical protein
MSHSESHVANAALGVATSATSAGPDIDHIQLPIGPLFKNIGSLHQPRGIVLVA